MKFKSIKIELFNKNETDTPFIGNNNFKRANSKLNKYRK